MNLYYENLYKTACHGGRQVARTNEVQSESMPKRGRAYGSSFQRNGADSHRGGRNNGWLDFEMHPMGVGESRLAFRCRIRDGCYRGYTEGSYCITKIFKNESCYSHMSVSACDVHMQVRARHLAQTFSDECCPTKYGEPCDSLRPRHCIIKV